MNVRTRLHTFQEWLFQVATPDIEQARRSRNTITISFGVILILVLAFPFIVLVPSLQSGLGVVIVSIVSCAVALLLARSRYSIVASLIISTSTIITGPISMITSNGIIAPFSMAISLFSASIMLKPRAVLIILVTDIIVLWWALLFPAHAFFEGPYGYDAAVYSTILLIMVAVLTYMSARNTYQELQAAQQFTNQTQHDRQILEMDNLELERRVVERSQELTDALSQQEAQTLAFQESTHIQDQLHQEILLLPVPIIPITTRVLIAPLIGIIDQARAERIVPILLAEIKRQRAKTLLLDVTGMAIIDRAVAQILIQIAETSRLLGTQTILIGLRPEVAQSLVAFNSDLRVLRSAASLQEGLLLCGAVVQ